MTLTERQQQIIAYTRAQLQAECLQLKLNIDRRSSNTVLRQALLADINVGYYHPTLTITKQAVQAIISLWGKRFRWVIKTTTQGKGFSPC